MHTEALFLPLSEEALEVLYSCAYEAYQKGKYEDAESFFQVLTWQKQNHCPYWIGLGASLQMLKRYEEAIAAYGYAAILNEKDPYVHLHAAECYHALNHKDKALQALDSALATSSKNDLSKQLTLLRNLWAQGGLNDHN